MYKEFDRLIKLYTEEYDWQKNTDLREGDIVMTIPPFGILPTYYRNKIGEIDLIGTHPIHNNQVLVSVKFDNGNSRLFNPHNLKKIVSTENTGDYKKIINI